MKNNKTVEYYMNLKYNIIVNERDDSSGHYYLGKVLELDGCVSDGETPEELKHNIREAMELYFETMLELDRPIPEPVSESNYSGKFNIRIPSSLHQRLAIEAKKEGVSLNQYCVYLLSK